jgi:hypothetical protein
MIVDEQPNLVSLRRGVRGGAATPHEGMLPSDHYAVIADLRH